MKSEETVIPYKDRNNDCIYDYIGNFPFFDPYTMADIGVYDKKFFKADPNGDYKEEENNIPVRKWYESYKLLYNGIYDESVDKLFKMRFDELNRLYSIYDDVIKEGNIDKINTLKQSILQLGWNPNVSFTEENRRMNDEIQRKNYKSRLSNCVDLTSENALVLESTKYVNKYPLYIFLSWTHTPFGKIIRKATKGIYTHSAFSLDTNLNRLYTFNGNVNGFSLEDINDENSYPHDEDSKMVLYCVMVNKNDIKTIKKELDTYLANIKSYSYGFITALGVALNKPIHFDHRLICSQFVDSLFKSINIDLTHKDSAIVSPNDFYVCTDKRLFKLYEGPIKDYDKHKVDRIMNKVCVYRKNSLTEAKEFPVQFDKDGNMLIKNIKRLDYQKEYENSHRLLMSYSETGNVAGMKYELSKLWFLNSELEKKIYHSNSDKDSKDEYYKIRSRVLNDFNKYLKEVQKYDKSFNFSEYYNNTPFSDASIKIDKYTLNYVNIILKKAILKK